ncbi:MAG: alpha/beta hydrolase [Chitinophagaceae bacterium]|jgi:pimeloyl-ACP methyl ester carboxylesterase|nr:alpha/beta hydrolase [Chitinophagaceae bacterium]OQY96277.1 MAG: alpha/beta hydrolase [Sphingobacteriales bacterium UTBCD1]
MKNYKTLSILIVTLILATNINAQPSSASVQKTDYGNNPQAGKYITNRGFKMYYETYGKGQPLLIIHGNGGSIQDFTNQIPFFEKHYKVILADSRAQGKSVDNGDSLSYEMMADDLNGLLDALKLDSCYVIGWSDGGINGLLLAIRHPDKVKKLAITGANLVPDTSAVEPEIYDWAKSLGDSINRLPLTPEVKTYRKLFHLLSYEPHITTAQLQTIKCPTLVIGGDHDVIRPPHTMLIAESIPKSYLWILPNSGHSTPVVYATIFNQVVNDFFKNPYRKIEGLSRLQ